jgi:hypothetical protein
MGMGEVVSVLQCGCSGDALNHPHPTQGGVLSNIPSTLSHSDRWDNFSSQRGAWVADGLTKASFWHHTYHLPLPSMHIVASSR